MTPTRALVLGGEPPAGALDVTTAFGALRLAGPLARETFARFSALDLRPQVTRPATGGRARSRAPPAGSCARARTAT